MPTPSHCFQLNYHLVSPRFSSPGRLQLPASGFSVLLIPWSLLFHLSQITSRLFASPAVAPISLGCGKSQRPYSDPQGPVGSASSPSLLSSPHPSAPHSLCSNHLAPSTMAATLLPQGLFTGCSLRLDAFPLDFCMTPSLPPFGSLLKCHFLRMAISDHPV